LDYPIGQAWTRQATIEHMPESVPPRIRVTLPGDTPGRITGWRQDKTGKWWAEVTVYAPADAVQQVPGEDYSHVPREPATPEPRYVLATDTRTQPPTVELHRADCWEISRPAQWRRITPVENPEVAQAAIRAADTTPCPVCTPEP
jgi:hypothetical protein